MRWAPEWSEHAKGVGASVAVEGRKETQLNNQLPKLETVAGAHQARSSGHSPAPGSFPSVGAPLSHWPSGCSGDWVASCS